jgi:hypothetical protein
MGGDRRSPLEGTNNIGSSLLGLVYFMECQDSLEPRRDTNSRYF